MAGDGNGPHLGKAGRFLILLRLLFAFGVGMEM